MSKDKDKDLLDDLLNVDKDDDDEIDPDALQKELQEMKQALEDAKKENHGLLNTVKKERGKRQNSDGRLEQLTATVNDIIENKKGASEPNKSDDTVDGIPVLYNDDGDPYLPTDKVNELFTTQQEEINQLKEALQTTASAQSAQSEAEKAKMAIVGENESFGPAYTKYQSARNWVEKKVAEWQADNNAQGQMIPSGYALDNIFDDALTEEFSKQYPEADLVSVVTAEDSFHHFRSMLNGMASTDETTKEIKEPDSRFKRVLNKPSNLGKSANANTEPTLAEKVGQLSSTDITELTDAQIRALEKAMLNEEKNEGIKF